MYTKLREIKDMLVWLDKTREERCWDTILHNQEVFSEILYNIANIIGDMAEEIEQIKYREVA